MTTMEIEETQPTDVSSLEKYRQHVYLFLVMIVIFTAGMCYSLQAPIYPEEAEAKGLIPSQYGFVFGVFQLVVFITSPIYGIYIKTIGPLFLFKAGIFLTSTCTILFGFLDKSPPGGVFLGLSIATRVVGAIGDSAVYTSSYILVIRLRPKSMGTAVAAAETSFGVGLIVGPTLGGCLYDVGGFPLPFFVVGGMLLALCGLSILFLRKIDSSTEDNSKDGPKIIDVLRNPEVIAQLTTLFAVAVGSGFIQGLLEPHIEPLNLTESQVGLIFMAMGGPYALSSIISGRIADKIGHFNLFSMAGNLTMVVGILFLGPAPFIHLKMTIGLVIGSLIAAGIGLGCSLINGLMGLLNTLFKAGHPKNLATQSFASGLFNAIYALGCFIGPTIGGFLYDALGFSLASMVFLGLLLFATLLLLGILVMKKVKKQRQEQIISHNEEALSKF